MRDAPGETLTFLFTDIEGSSRRWDRDDVAMAAALERHDRLLREVLDAHGARWVKHTGDGLLAVFASALAAVTAAVQMQEAMLDEDWSAVGGLRARMAVHTGEARHRDGDYFGQAVNRAARLLSAAHGGQVLLSLATEEIVRDRLPEGVTLRDLGTHDLPGLSHHERVFQLEAPRLPAAFPPLAGAREAAPVLPAFRTTFVGRERDLSALAEALDVHRVVTLTGVGGSGKTRLAVEVARSVAGRFPDGVFFVDLAAIADEEFVARQTAQALGALAGGASAAASEPVRQQLARALRDRRMLILLDNCEHLLDACADHVEDLLAASPGVHVLATSREALALDGEQAWPVSSLDIPDDDHADVASMQLLLDRVRELRPDFAVEAGDHAHLVQICRRLDGLPLAIELVAARLAHMSAADVVSRLDDRFRLLVGGRRRTERHQTLGATIDWSHDLLDEPERVVLRRLSAFAGGAPLDAVEAVCLDGLASADAVDVLGLLASRSLVVVDTSASRTRYRLLETIRLYGEDKLVAAGEAEAVRDRHRDWALGWLESFDWDRRLISLAAAAEIHREYDNLRLALEWSASRGRPDLVARLVIGLTGFAIGYGYGDELDRWYVFARDADLEPPLRAALEVHRAWLEITTRYRGDPARFEELRELAAGAYHRLPEGDPFRALARLAYAASYSTRPDVPQEMEQAAAEAAELAVAGDAPWIQTAAMGFQAVARLYDDNPAAAADVVREAMALPVWTPEHDGYNLQRYLAVSLHLMGENEEALRYALPSDRRTGSWAHIGLFDAVIIAARGDLDGARDHVRRGLTDVEATRWQHPMALTDCTIVLAAIATLERRFEDAARLLACSQGGTSNPALFAVWRHYRDRVRDALPRDVRQRHIDEGRHADVAAIIEQELSRP